MIAASVGLVYLIIGISRLRISVWSLLRHCGGRAGSIELATRPVPPGPRGRVGGESFVLADRVVGPTKVGFAERRAIVLGPI